VLEYILSFPQFIFAYTDKRII